MAQKISRGDRDYRLAVLAMLAAGVTTFSSLYSTQAMLPTLVAELGITPSTAALTVSMATGALAACVVPASILSERFGRGRVLLTSAFLAAALALLLPLAHGAAWLIALRALQGVALAGVPAVAMAWLAEEITPTDVGRAMGVYIAGTTLGGLAGRLITSGVLEFAPWRAALATQAVVAIGCALVAWRLLPRQRNFSPKRLRAGRELRAMVGHLRNPRLLALNTIAFGGMGAFVSLYNYVGFEMISRYGLSEALVGAVFIMYLSGTVSSAQAGALAERFGRAPVLTAGAAGMAVGVGLIAIGSLPLLVAGLLVFTAAFFAMHSIASGSVGIIATAHRGEAASMYLSSYYVGSSVLGWATGAVFGAAGFGALLAVLAAITACLTAVAFALRR